MIFNNIKSRKVLLIVGVIVIALLVAVIIWYEPIREYIRNLNPLNNFAGM